MRIEKSAKAALEFQDILIQMMNGSQKKKSSASSKLRLHSLDRITRREAHVAAEDNIDHEIETIWKNIGIYDAGFWLHYWKLYSMGPKFVVTIK